MTKMTADDFEALGVRRPLIDEDIQADPQAAVDKTLNTGEEESEVEEGVDSPQSRCEICFGPKPCEQHANIEQFDAVTTLDIDPTAVLADAHNKGLSEVVIVGFDNDGNEYFASSASDAAASIYHMQRGIYRLNKIMDKDENERRNGPSKA